MATISDDLPNRILIGAITVHDDVAQFDGKTVLLKDGCKIEHIDVVVMATGYHFSFPFLDESIIRIDGNYPRLYNLVFPVDLEHCGTLAVIGLVQPFGSLPPILEMQARVATRVFAQKCSIPKKQDMVEVVEKRRAFLKLKYVDTPRYSLQVYFIDYLDTLANMIGCRPNLWKLFFTDPKLWYRIYFGPATPPQWRLEGPGQWEGARTAISSVKDKTLFPMKTRVAGNGERDGLYDGWMTLFKWIALLSVFCIYCLHLWSKHTFKF